MVVRPFEAACAECHSAEIHGSGQTGDKGIPVLVVPGLDMVLIEERGLPIGEWPEDAERGVPPLMQILLQADPAYREIAPRIAGLDLLDLSDADDETVAAVEVLAWSVKRLFHELASGGQEALQGRLEAVLGEISADQLVALSGMLPADAVQRVNLAWFPNLADEVAKHHRGQRVPFRIADREPDDAVPVTSPAKEVSADTAGILDSAEEESADILGEPDVSGETSDILGGSDDTGESLNILGESNVTGEEDILGGLQGNEIDVLGETEETETLSSSPSTEVNPEETAKAGGWYREYFALFFRPAGHEDRFYRRWLESASAAMKTNPSLAVEATLDLFTATETPGRCIKCHSVDRDEHGLVEVNWHAKRPNPERHHSTRFSHNAHLSLTGDAGCLYCHAWRENPSDDFLAAYGQEDPFVDSGNFKHLEKAVCTECHRPGQVTDSCLNCHNYHVVESDLNVPEAMATLDSSDANAL
jgi:hypothetical protein